MLGRPEGETVPAFGCDDVGPEQVSTLGGLSERRPLGAVREQHLNSSTFRCLAACVGHHRAEMQQPPGLVVSMLEGSPLCAASIMFDGAVEGSAL